MILAYITQAAIAFNVLLALLFKPSDFVISAILFLLGMVIYVVAWQTKIKFPWFVYFLISLALLIHTSGYVQGRYVTYEHWDMLAHTVSGTIVALLGFLFVLYLDTTRKYNLDPSFIALFIVFFGMGMEFLWEVWEFFVDTFFGGSLAGPMQGGNTDTMTDMIFVLIASLIVGMVCYYYLKRYTKETVVHDMVKDSPYFPTGNPVSPPFLGESRESEGGSPTGPCRILPEPHPAARRLSWTTGRDPGWQPLPLRPVDGV